MKYIRFKGRTPYPNTSYVAYLAFEDNVSDVELKEQSKELAIENANRHSVYFDREFEELNLDDWDFSEKYQDYISNCIDLGTWKVIGAADFDYATLS